MNTTFDYTITEGIASIRLRKGAFVLGTDLDAKERFLDTFKELGESEEVRAVLLVNDPDVFTKHAHQEFVKSLTADAPGGDTKLLSRQDNAFFQYAMQATSYDKLLVSCLQGEIASPFFALSLLSDLRIAEPNMFFCLSHVDLGLPSVAGLGYLLPRFIGQGHAASYMFAGGKIGTTKAAEFGLINAVVSANSFESECIDWVQKILAQGNRHIAATSRLLHDDIDSFKVYLEKEAKHRFHSLHNP